MALLSDVNQTTSRLGQLKLTLYSPSLLAPPLLSRDKKLPFRSMGISHSPGDLSIFSSRWGRRPLKGLDGLFYMPDPFSLISHTSGDFISLH